MFSSQSTPSLEEHHLFWAPCSSLTPGTLKPRIRWWMWKHMSSLGLREEFLADLPADNGGLRLLTRAASSGQYDFPFLCLLWTRDLAILLLMSGFGSREEEAQHHLLYPRDQNWHGFLGGENNRESSLAAVEPSSWWHCPLLGSFPWSACTA